MPCIRRVLVSGASPFCPSMLLELTWLLGVITLGLLSPGPDFFLIVRNSVGTTRARALATVAGITTGLAVQTTIIALGLSAAPHGVLRGVQYAGAAFLAYLGLRALLSRPAAATDNASPIRAAGEARTGYIEGLLCNITNPKTYVFFLSVFAQVLKPGPTAEAWRLLLPVVISAHGAIGWGLIVLALQSPPVASRLLEKPPPRGNEIEGAGGRRLPAPTGLSSAD